MGSIQENMLVYDRWIGGPLGSFYWDVNDVLQWLPVGEEVPPDWVYAGSFRNLGQNTVPPACSISYKNPGKGDNPFLWCTASENAGENTRVLKDGIADYTPNKYIEFDIWAQPGNNPGGIDYSTSPINEASGWSNIYSLAHSYFMDYFHNEEEWDYIDGTELFTVYVRPPQAHCERLGFFSNVDRSGNLTKTGWFKPGGTQANLPPVPQDVSLWKRVAGSNLCLPLIKRDIENYSYVYRTALDQDLPHTLKTARNENGYLIDANTIYSAYPGFRNPYGGTEVWAGWSPSIIGREGDQPPPMLGEAFSLTDKDITEYWTAGQNGWHWANPEITYENTTTYARGSYDWRFLNTIIRRTNFIWSSNDPGPGDTRVTQYRYSLMYWWLDNQFPYATGMPGTEGSPASVRQSEFFETVIIPEAERLGIPRNTIFDCKIQAGVFAMRCSPDMADLLDYAEYAVKRLSSNSHCVRVWSHTRFKVQIRQCMPVPNLA